MKVSLCIKMNVINMIMLLLISQCMMMLFVNGEYISCEAGEGAAYGKIFTSGDASQCSGLSKITTEAECELAAEYNSKNNIDKNEGYGGTRTNSGVAPGCYYWTEGKKYVFNHDKATGQCTNERPCICKKKTCTKCPINTYSKGGTNPTCTPCPPERPFTAKFSDQKSSASCTKSKDDIACKAGEGMRPTDIRASGKKACTKCPINTFSKGVINPTCIQCPEETPFTAKFSDQNSIASCTKSNDDIECKAGEGLWDPTDIRTSGDASQCTGLSKITTEADCKLAAEYNSKNNIDKNEGWGGRRSGSGNPPGCFYHSGSNKYYWNYKTSPTKCSNSQKCICKAKASKCTTCPINTYSKGGINPTCTPCPNDRPSTGGQNNKKSIDGCIKAQECGKGDGMLSPTDIRTSGDASECNGIYRITTAAECRLAAEYNRKNNIDNNKGFYGERPYPGHPHGCYSMTGNGNNLYAFNIDKSIVKCNNVDKCICKSKTCNKCPPQYYSPGGDHVQCKKCDHYLITTSTNEAIACKLTCPDGYENIPSERQRRCRMCQEDHKSKGGEPCKKCPDGTTTNGKIGSSSCPGLTKGMTDKFNNIFQRLDEQKEKTNDLSIKNSRLWQKEQIRLQHDEYMKKRKEQDDKNETSSCIKQRSKGTIVFPAIEISNEIEKIEDTTCIDTNRDELLKSFCSFTSDLDNLFQIQGITDKKAKSFWPNICCKERRDTTLEVCKDPSGELNRGEIVPFALSSGGNYSHHNLYVEVTDTIKKDGYLHEGMKKLLHTLGRSKTKHAKKLVDSFFNEVSLCGPRIVDAPGEKDKTKLCELFIPYQHSMTQFYHLIEKIFYQPLNAQQSSSFLQTMENALHTRQHNGRKRLGKNTNTNMQQIMKAKPGATKAKAEQQCNHEVTSTKWTMDNLAKMKDTYCTGYNHIDLSNTDVKNIAIHYLKNDLKYDDKKMFSLKQALRYDIKDSSCPAAPLFTANDISIQQVNMDTLGKEKEWVAVVNLNTQDKNSYLQSELPYCKAREYLIGAKVEVKAYIDDSNCCDDLKDYTKCKGKDTCKDDKLTELKDNRDKHYSKDVILTGTHYEVTNSIIVRRRRRMLQKSRAPPT